MSEMPTFLLAHTHSDTDKHTRAHGAGVRDRRRDEEHRMDGHRGNGQLAAVEIVLGHVIAGGIVTMRKLKGAKQGEQQREGGLISKRAKEESLRRLNFFQLSPCERVHGPV